ncbi:DoxX family protein [Dyadobacter sp. CY345]|uniref:DoxX family protein n=1 Tax=Dyadobacter sp. CY345 TaxID=2909335 RepID=UPI001F3AFB5B|nr:DoxX family protein [Dyadobacter sp. CY345]MCF2444884.1 DoxX family protein [Dyadobacter sp. CY345]
MKFFFVYLMSAFFIFAGIVHFLKPGVFLEIMPKFLPYPLQLVYISGACEILFAVLLAIPSTRHIGAWLIILLLIAVFPANIQMALTFYKEKNPYLWVALLRLPLQFALIWWAWLYTKI